MLSADNDLKYVYLYAAQGASQFCADQTEKSFREYLGGRSARLIKINDLSYLQSRDWFKEVEAFVVPGGNANEMYCALAQGEPTKASAFERLKDYINNKGGNYLGFCAGALLAGTISLKEPNKTATKSLKTVELTLLDFVKSRVICPAYPFGEGISLPSAQTARAVKVAFGSPAETATMLWNGGGYYIRTCNFSEKPLVYYKDLTLEMSLGAAVAGLASYPFSCVVTCNVHPELQLDLAEIEKQFPHIENKEELAASLPQQKKLFATLCNYAHIKP